MRIAVFSLAYYPFEGGAEIAAREIARRLPFEFTVFTQRFGTDAFPSEKTGYVEIVRLGGGSKNLYGNNFGKFLYIFRAWRAAEARHKKQPFDRVWAIMASYGGASALLFKLRHPEIPMLLTLQEGDSETHILGRVGVFYPLWRLIFKKADCVQAISLYLADFARRHGATCQIDVIPNGVNLTKFQITNSKAQISSKFQIPNPKIIITTSRLVYKNGVDVLIRAAAQLKKLQTSPPKADQPLTENFKLQIVGDGPLRGDLEKLAVNLGVSDVVEFKGQVPAEEIPQYLIGADIFVRPSRSEGLGSSFLEAMAAGLPVIGTPVGGIPDFLKDGETGFFFKVDDSNDLAEKILLLLKDEKLRQKLSSNGRKLVQENYSWDIISGKMRGIFDSLHPTPYTLHPRILIATGLYPPEVGGPATYTALLESELKKRGVLVEVLPFSSMRHLPIGIRHFMYFLRCLGLARRATVVYAQDPVSVGLPALCAARFAGKSFIIRVAGDYAWEQAVQRFGVADSIDAFQAKRYGLRTEALRSVQNFVVRRARAVIVPSKYFCELVGRWVGDQSKVRHIYNGIEINSNPKPQTLNPKTKVIISAGRLMPWKGFDALIELLAELPEWRLEIIGDGPELENLKLKTKNLKLDEKISFLGAVSREELRERMASARVFVLNTSFESFSFQIVEAMACGTPVIATHIGNLAEIIEDGKEGLLVEPNNREAIKAAIEHLDNDPIFRGNVVEAARRKTEQFSIERTTDQLLEVIRNTIEIK